MYLVSGSITLNGRGVCCGGVNQKIDAQLVNKLSEGQQRHWEIDHFYYREVFGRVQNKHQESFLTFACPYLYCRSVTISVEVNIKYGFIRGLKNKDWYCGCEI